MDNRWRFLYCVQTELRGRGRIVEPGDGEPGPSAKACTGGKSTVRELKREGERKRSSEGDESTPPRKAAIALYAPVPKTDTGG